MTIQDASQFFQAMTEFRYAALALQHARIDSPVLLARRRTAAKRLAFRWAKDCSAYDSDILRGSRLEMKDFEKARMSLLSSYTTDPDARWALRRARWRREDGSTGTLQESVRSWTDWRIDVLWRTRDQHVRSRGPQLRSIRIDSMAALSSAFLLLRGAEQGDGSLEDFGRAGVG